MHKLWRFADFFNLLPFVPTGSFVTLFQSFIPSVYVFYFETISCGRTLQVSELHNSFVDIH